MSLLGTPHHICNLFDFIVHDGIRKICFFPDFRNKQDGFHCQYHYGYFGRLFVTFSEIVFPCYLTYCASFEPRNKLYNLRKIISLVCVMLTTNKNWAA